MSANRRISEKFSGKIEKYRENYIVKSMNIDEKVYLKPNKPNKKTLFSMVVNPVNR